MRNALSRAGKTRKNDDFVVCCCFWNFAVVFGGTVSRLKRGLIESDVSDLLSGDLTRLSGRVFQAK